MARGQWTNHSSDCQAELLALLKDAGGNATMLELYQRGAWGIRTATIKALLRKGKIECAGSDIWRDRLQICQHRQGDDYGSY
jgi:hypothetical protein